MYFHLNKLSICDAVNSWHLLHLHYSSVFLFFFKLLLGHQIIDVLWHYSLRLKDRWWHPLPIITSSNISPHGLCFFNHGKRQSCRKRNIGAIQGFSYDPSPYLHISPYPLSPCWCLKCSWCPTLPKLCSDCRVHQKVAHISQGKRTFEKSIFMLSLAHFKWYFISSEGDWFNGFCNSFFSIDNEYFFI